MRPEQDERLVIAFERIGTALLRMAQVLENDQAREVTERMERVAVRRCLACTHPAEEHDHNGCHQELGVEVGAAICGCRRARSLIDHFTA